MLVPRTLDLTTLQAMPCLCSVFSLFPFTSTPYSPSCHEEREERCLVWPWGSQLRTPSQEALVKLATQKVHLVLVPMGYKVTDSQSDVSHRMSFLSRDEGLGQPGRGLQGSTLK